MAVGLKPQTLKKMGSPYLKSKITKQKICKKDLLTPSGISSK